MTFIFSILLSLALLQPSVGSAASLRDQAPAPAAPAAPEKFPISYSEKSCPMLIDANRCALERKERHRAYRHSCREQVKGQHDSAESLEERQKNCFRNSYARGNATCAACKPIMAARAAKPSGLDINNSSSVTSKKSSSAGKPGDNSKGQTTADTSINCTAESCQRKNADELKKAKEAASERRQEYKQSRQAASESRTSTITSAATLLDSWKQTIDSNPRTPPAENARYQSDLKIFQRAEASLNNPEAPFRKEDAKMVSDPGIREDLSLFAEADELDKDLHREDQRLMADEQQYESLAFQSDNRAVALNNHAGQIKASTTPAHSAATISASEPSPSSPSSKASRDSLIAEKEVGDAAGDVAQATSAPLGSKHSPLPGRSLRDSLRKRLQAGADSSVKGRDKDAFQGEAFEKGLNKDGINLSIDKPEKTHVAEALISEAKHWSQSGGLSPASEVQATVDEFERQLASASGQLDMETATLFARVRAAHRSCVARECVNSVKP